MSKSIRYYYFTSIAAVLAASVFVMGLVQMYLATTYFRTEKEKLLEQVVTEISSAIMVGQIGIQDTSLQTVQHMARIAGASVFIATPEGIVVFSTDDAPLVGSQINTSLLEKAIRKGSYREVGRLEGLFKSNFYTMGAPLINIDGQMVGFVFASSDALGLRVYLTDMLSSFILSAGLVMLVASVLALFLSNRIVIPLRRISKAARQFGEGDYSARVPVEGDQELAQLAVTFNEMANSFEATDHSRRSFMGNIAHELRTPMTSIKGFIDGMLDGTIPESQRDKYLAIVSEEVGRLARLTRNMLDISRLEAGEYIPQTTEFNIWEPITSVFLSSEKRLEEKKIRVEGMDAVGEVLVKGDEDFVHQILFNLVDNAIKFTEDEGTISVFVKAGKNCATVSICNTGSGILPEALPYIFDRFYKEDKSRGVNAKGSGLGLHICKVLVGLMGGRIWAESEFEKNSTFYFTLPNGVPRKMQGLRRNETKAKNNAGNIEEIK